MNALQELIRRRTDERGWSYGTIARQGGLSRSTVHRLATTEALQRVPNPDTLEQLALGLHLPLQVVREAAAEAAGIQVYGTTGMDPDVAVVVASLEQLDAEDRGHVVALVESLLEARGAKG